MRSAATTVDQYLASLPEDRRSALQAVRSTILEHLPDGYEEAMNWGMISYQVPLATYPEAYNGEISAGSWRRTTPTGVHQERADRVLPIFVLETA